MAVDIKIPEIGEGVESGSVVAILKQAGDRVEVEEGIIEVETQKAVVEIPSPVNGRVTEMLVSEGDEVNVGDVIARVDTEVESAVDDRPQPEAAAGRRQPEPGKGGGEATSDAPAGREGAEPVGDEPGEDSPSATEPVGDEPGDDNPSVAEPVVDIPDNDHPTGDKSTPLPASPSVRRLARELGVDLRSLPLGGLRRISAEDVKAFVGKEGSTAVPKAARPGPGPATGSPEFPDLSRWGEVEAEELSTVRRLTAESTTFFWHTVPHVTQFDQADITDLEAFIRDHAAQVRDAGGKLTVTAVLAAICARALKRLPRFNASIDMANNRLIYRHYVHVGIAVDTPRGLLVPVVRDADRKTITELAVEIFDLAERARSKKIKQDELEGGTFTISNQGGIGGTGFTPIVLWPQAAILGVSRTQDLPQIVEDRIEARRVLPLALSYDHRIIDGADAARFLRWVCDSLSQPLTMHLD